MLQCRGPRKCWWSNTRLHRRVVLLTCEAPSLGHFSNHNQCYDHKDKKNDNGNRDDRHNSESGSCWMNKIFVSIKSRLVGSRAWKTCLQRRKIHRFWLCSQSFRRRCSPGVGRFSWCLGGSARWLSDWRSRSRRQPEPARWLRTDWFVLPGWWLCHRRSTWEMVGGWLGS